MAPTRVETRSERVTKSPKQPSSRPLSRSPGQTINVAPSSTRYFRKFESGAGVFAPAPGGSARESSISLVRKRRLLEDEEDEAYSKRARYESGSDTSALTDIKSEDENKENERPHLAPRPGTPGIIRPDVERGTQPQSRPGSIVPRRIRPPIQEDNVFVESSSDLPDLEHYRQPDQIWNHDQIVSEEPYDSLDHHAHPRYENLASADINQAGHQNTYYQHPASTGDTPLRNMASPLSDDGAAFEFLGYPDFRSRRPHRTKLPPRLRRTADQDLHFLVRESVELEDLYEADGETSASTDSQSCLLVAGPTPPLSSPHKKDGEHPRGYRSRNALNHPSKERDRRAQANGHEIDQADDQRDQDIYVNHNLHDPEIEGMRRDTDEELKQSSLDGLVSEYAADGAARQRAGRDEGYTEGFAAARRSGHGEGYSDEPRNAADAIILALRRQIERQEAELARLRNEAAEQGAYTGREVGHHLGLEEGGRKQWEENQEIIDEQSDESDAIYDQGFAEGQAEARRERGLAIQTAYRAGYVARGAEMMGFIHRSAGREPFEYHEEHDDWP